MRVHGVPLGGGARRSHRLSRRFLKLGGALPRIAAPALGRQAFSGRVRFPTGGEPGASRPARRRRTRWVRVGQQIRCESGADGIGCRLFAACPLSPDERGVPFRGSCGLPGGCARPCAAFAPGVDTGPSPEDFHGHTRPPYHGIPFPAPATPRPALNHRHAAWHADIVARAVQGFIAERWAARGIAPDAIDAFEVPGAFEIPLLARRLASGRYRRWPVCLRRRRRHLPARLRWPAPSSTR